MNSPRILAALVAVAALSLGAARAADFYWTNTLGGNWNVAANWSPNQVPGLGDNVFITQAGTYSVAVNVNATLGSLMAGAASGTQTVAMASQLTLSNNSTFSSRTVLRLVGASLGGLGEITANGLVEWTGGVIVGPGIFNANGGMAISGSENKAFAGTNNNGGTVTWTGSGELQAFPGAVFNNPAGKLVRRAD